jgi:hypothetical protein
MREATAKTRWARRAIAAGGFVVSAVVLGQLALVGPLAAVPGLGHIKSKGPFDSAAKSQNVDCPAGSKVLAGGGATLGSGSGQIGMDIMVPVAGGTTFQVTGREDESGVAGIWAIISSVVCAPPPPGLVTVSGNSAPAFGKLHWYEKSCPPGKRAIGVGGAVAAGGRSEVILSGLRIHQKSVVVTGHEDETGFADDWWLTAHAICADPLPGEERLTTDSTFSSAIGQSVTATCPAGKRVHGFGGEIVGGKGQVRLTQMQSSSSTVVVTAVEDKNGFNGTWKLRADAVCAN